MPVDYNSLARTLAEGFRAREERRQRAFAEEDLLTRRAREDEEYAYKTGERRRQDAATEALATSLEGEPPASMLRAAASPEPAAPMPRSPFQPPRPLVQKPAGYSYPAGFKGPRSALKTPERLAATTDAIAEAYATRTQNPQLAALLRADRATGMRLYSQLLEQQAGDPARIYEARQAADKESYSRGRDTILDKRHDAERSENRSRQSRLDKIAEAREAREAAGFETPGQKRFGDTAADITKEGAKRLLGMFFPSAGENIAATNAGVREREGAAKRTSGEKIAAMRQATAKAQMELQRALANAKSENDFKQKAWEIREQGIAALVKSGDISPSEAARHYDAEVQGGTFSDTITIPRGGGPQPSLVPGGGATSTGQPPPEVTAALDRLQKIEAAIARKKGGASGGR